MERILTSGQLLDYASEHNISPLRIEQYLLFQAAYSLAVLRETYMAGTVKIAPGSMPDAVFPKEAPVSQELQDTLDQVRSDMEAVAGVASAAKPEPPKEAPTAKKIKWGRK